MTQDRYQLIKQVFMAAVEQPTERRAAYLDQACHNDAMLREEVDFLLASDECATNFIENPALASVSELLKQAAPEFDEQPRRIGPYDLLGVIGSGGMGTVYRAVRADDQYRKLVAIKLVRKELEHDAIVQRFRRERQILASLDHPNIAQLLDGGTIEDGRPYFVLEFVDGLPMDHYCDQHKLSTRQRLELFRTVCSAVEHAHRNLVIHRDLKPGNILVKSDGTIKLLDFGIAKVLHPDAATQALERTATALRIMTPQYASPEQVRGDTLSTASDVYLLGLVLYELLTGHRPYRIRSGETMEVMRALALGELEKPSTAVSRVIVETSASGAERPTVTPELVSRTREGRPQRLRRLLSGDIDHIVLKALRKEPAERYGSAAEFSEDIRRHLMGRPVHARKNTLAYRASRFAGRHKGAVLASSIALLTVMAGAGGLVWQGQVAKGRLARAERRFDRSHALAQSIWTDLDSALDAGPAGREARRLLVSKALLYLADLERETAGELVVERRIADGYARVARLQADLGDVEGALTSHRKSGQLYETLSRRDPNGQAQGPLAEALEQAAAMEAENGEFRGALESSRRAISLREGAAALAPVDVAAKEALVRSLDLAAVLELRGGQPGKAVEASRRALGFAQELFARGARDRRTRRLLALAQQRYGEALDHAGDSAAALESLGSAHGPLAALASEEPASRQAKQDLARAQEKLALAQSRTGVTAGSLEGYRKAVALRREMVASDPSGISRADLAASLLGWGDLLGRTQDRSGAATAYREALDLLKPAQTAAYPSPRKLLLAYQHVCAAVSAGAVTGGSELHRQMLDFARAWLTREPNSSFAAQMTGLAYTGLSEALGKSGDKQSALTHARQAVSVFDSLTDKGPLVRRNAALASVRLGDALIEAGAGSAEACAAHRRSHQLLTELSGSGVLASGDAALLDRARTAASRCQ